MFQRRMILDKLMIWLTKLDRLPTRSRIAIWGVNLVGSCCDCNVYAESRDHLFLRCVFSEQIWILITTLWDISHVVSTLGWHSWNGLDSEIVFAPLPFAAQQLKQLSTRFGGRGTTDFIILSLHLSLLRIRRLTDWFVMPSQLGRSGRSVVTL